MFVRPSLLSRQQSDTMVADNYRILFNDSPYSLDHGIVHLVLWTKFPLTSHPIDTTDVDATAHHNRRGDLDDEAYAAVDNFVRRTFAGAFENGDDRDVDDRILWFRNPASLRSIHTVDHAHLLLLSPNEAFVRWVILRICCALPL